MGSFVSTTSKHEYAFARQKNTFVPFTLSDNSRAQLFVVRYCASAQKKKAEKKRKAPNTFPPTVMLFWFSTKRHTFYQCHSSSASIAYRLFISLFASCFHFSFVLIQFTKSQTFARSLLRNSFTYPSSLLHLKSGLFSSSFFFLQALCQLFYFVDYFVTGRTKLYRLLL